MPFVAYAIMHDTFGTFYDYATALNVDKKYVSYSECKIVFYQCRFINNFCRILFICCSSIRMSPQSTWRYICTCTILQLYMHPSAMKWFHSIPVENMPRIFDRNTRVHNWICTTYMAIEISGYFDRTGMKMKLYRIVFYMASNDYTSRKRNYLYGIFSEW